MHRADCGSHSQDSTEKREESKHKISGPELLPSIRKEVSRNPGRLDLQGSAQSKRQALVLHDFGPATISY